jgi:hypothetical protein
MGARPIAIIIHQDMVARNFMIVKTPTSDQERKVMWFFFQLLVFAELTIDIYKIHIDH